MRPSASTTPTAATTSGLGSRRMARSISSSSTRPMMNVGAVLGNVVGADAEGCGMVARGTPEDR